MAKIDNTYHKLLETIKKEGRSFEDPNRKGIYRIQIPDYKIEHKFSDGFPAITTKKLYWKAVVGELIWFLRGETNIKYLVDNNINIWNKDAYNYYLKTSDNPTYTLEEFVEYIASNDEKYLKAIGFGELGRVYGAQWRDFTKVKDSHEGLEDINVDQLEDMLSTLLTNPMSSSKIVTSWDPGEIQDMALPPCHWSWEIITEPLTYFERVELTSPELNNSKEPILVSELDGLDIPEYRFTLKWNQRSVDTFLGLPFNIASYGILACLIGSLTNMVPHKIVGNLSNVHIYEPHLNAVNLQLANDPNLYEAPIFNIQESTPHREFIKGRLPLDLVLDRLNLSDFNLLDYENLCYGAIPAPMLPYSK